MSMPVYRRQFGLILGAIIGLAAGLVTQSINHILMPGIPLYQPPLGAAGNTLLCLLLGALLGLVTAWPDVSIKGMLLGSLFAAVILLVSTTLIGATDSSAVTQRAVVLFFILTPMIGLLAPVLIAFRWIVSREEMFMLESRAGFQNSKLGRWVLPTLLVIIAGLVGLLAIQPEMARAVIPHMHALIQNGQQAQNVEALPEPLKSKPVRHFMEKGGGKYELEWQKDDQNLFLVDRPLAPLDQQSIVIAHYENGYRLICRFPGETGEPNCKDFE